MLPARLVEQVSASLATANSEFAVRYPGESERRQAVHTVYGGAHIFKADTAARLGALALKSLDEFAPDAQTLGTALEIRDAGLAALVYARVKAKLEREPVEDFRLDFEDGYGNRADAEEDGHAASSALEVAAGMTAGALPPFIGIRIKPFNEDLKSRSIRTLDIFLSSLLAKAKRVPENFVVTLPKVVHASQVAALVSLFESLEDSHGLAAGTLKVELMIETPQSIIDGDGTVGLPKLIRAGQGRCTGAHFGVYDYTASCNITASYQTMGHQACNFARQMMLVSLAGTGIHISDGATNILPVGPHRAAKDGPPLTAEQRRENVEAVHAAWLRSFRDNQHSLSNGFYQGWDLHPAQLVTRYAAVYEFFLSGIEAASSRLKAFVEKAALASLHGDVFDDAATGQGLLNFFLRGINCGAITEEEATATGLTIAELRSRSFLKILQGRRK